MYLFAYTRNLPSSDQATVSTIESKTKSKLQTMFLMLSFNIRYHKIPVWNNTKKTPINLTGDKSEYMLTECIIKY